MTGDEEKGVKRETNFFFFNREMTAYLYVDGNDPPKRKD